MHQRDDASRPFCIWAWHISLLSAVCGTLGGVFGHTEKSSPGASALALFALLNMTLHFVTRWLPAALTVACLFPAQVQAQERIYRCGNEYTNDVELARSRGCKPMDGGNFTVIQNTTPARTAAPAPAPRAAAPSPAPAVRNGGERVDSSAQRARDSDARAILEAELRKAQERLAQAQKAYANGSPEKEGIEGRNHQRYLDRVAELKSSVTRAEGDVDSIRRELSRLPGGATGPGGAVQ